ILLMEMTRPGSAEELAAQLADAASSGRSIRLGGAFSKDRMAGPVAPADLTISTTGLSRVLQYEPRDLTISVEAGLPFAELSRILAANRQMVPLEPPFESKATVGGVISANCSGPRRRLYGTARDLVIGIKFATLEGKFVQSGGMVVKNVAGLDMGKLMIGSFGTLAAIAVVNFKLIPMPAASRTFIGRFPTLEEAIASRDQILTGVLQPSALDLLNPQAAVRVGLVGYCLLLRAGGNPAMMDRYAKELPGAEILEGQAEEDLWRRVQEFTPAFLDEYSDGAVVRVSSTLTALKDVLKPHQIPVLARAAAGVSYLYFADAGQAAVDGGKGVVEYAPEEKKGSLDLWPSPGNDFAIMKRIKEMFDPKQLLNRGRLYGRI
ncbi:MAG: FAD-binding oxidoreductase, partial [Bryobacteraceae bacterium]